MPTNMFRPFLVFIITITVIFNSIVPSYISAEAVEQKDNSDHLVDQYKAFELGPDGMKAALETTGSNSLVMDLYALTVIKQPDINFNNIQIINENLQNKILSDQTNARGNAKVWLDQLKPQLIATNQNIINYDNRFTGYYDTLLEAAENKDTKALTARLNRLVGSISDNKAEVDHLITNLKQFRQKLQSDTQNLKTDTNALSSILASQDAGIPLLQKQIETYHEAISKYNNILIASSVATSLGPITIIGGIAVIATGAGTPLGIALIAGGTGTTGGGITGIVLAKQGIDRAEEAIKSITGKVTEAQMQLAAVTSIKEQMEYLTKTIDQAINSLQNISTQWSTLNAKYTSLLNNLDVMSPEEFDLLKEDLAIAKMSWDNLRDFAEKLYINDIKVVDNR